jgi:glycosyltransferase
MKLSIITPVYNDPRLRHSLESIRNQEGIPKPEIVVVDGDSTDETVDIINEFRDVIDILVREPDDGIYDAMNKGIRHASGEIIGILNADDRYQDEYVLRDILTRMEDTGAKTCYGDLVYVNENDEPVRYWNSGSFKPKRIYRGWMPPHPTFFVRSEVYDKYGMFDLEYRIAADYDLMLRFLLKHGVSTTYLDRTLVRMAIGGKSNQSVLNIFKSNWEVARSWRKHGLRGGPIVSFLKPLRKIPQYINTPS